MAGPNLKLDIKKLVFTRRVKRHVARNLNFLGQELRGLLAIEVSTPYPPASRVGEAPHRRTGTLQMGFQHQVKEGLFSVTLRVFTNVPYARRLEFGFVGTDRLGRNINQGARPYWRPVLTRSRIGPRIARP